jgi:phosphatidate cytidylyltransferase
MKPSLREQLLDCENAFEDGFVSALTVCVVVIVVAVPLAIFLLGRFGHLSRGIALLSLLCYREYARGTGLFREKLISFVVVLSIVAITLAVLDRWYALFISLTPLSIGVLGTAALLSDRPRGYVQRVALGVLAVVLFGMCLAHVGYCANRAHYRPLILWLLASTLAHPLIARPMRRLPGPVLLPNTAPGRTLLGDGIATLVTVGLSSLLGHFAFRATVLDEPLALVALGLTVGVAGWFSDLMLAAVRRDLGISEPAVGRLVDHVGGLILTAPAVFYYVNYHVDMAGDQLSRILTGG